MEFKYPWLFLQRGHHLFALVISSWVSAMVLSDNKGMYLMTQNAASYTTALQTSVAPGVIIAHSPAVSGKYIGSPAIAILPNGDYIVSHDFFGPAANHRSAPITNLYKSRDNGQTWKKITEITPLFWNTLFVHQGKLYSLGIQNEYGHVLIRRSDDGGKTWTEPTGGTNGLLKTGTYHSAPCPVVIHKNRLWSSVELAEGERPDWSAMVMSAPVDADLLDSESWIFSEPLQHSWSNSQWIEGNVVVTPEGKLVNILRTNGKGRERAVITHVSTDGLNLTHNPEKDTLDFPGGGVKFTVRYDARTARYWAIVNLQASPDAGRNHLVLTSSKDLEAWHVVLPLYSHPDQYHHAWQYVDWLIEGDDIIFVSRTAYDDMMGGADNDHNANYLTFHRIKDFRSPASIQLITH